MIKSINLEGLRVLGDIPLRCFAPQTVFVQMSLLAKPIKFRLSFEGFKFLIARQVFRFNSRFASAFIVQTDVMRALLSASYPSIANRIHVIAQPVPEWLLEVRPHSSLGRIPPSQFAQQQRIQFFATDSNNNQLLD